ncbi:SICAvar, type I [Plasmodium knowlesi strain H]|uniref:SICAvar, type I n=3 Tax=Plasmodium knowlesi TaxID=5850 RepID=A0A1A7VN41_PLAKH|nr:SICAvar, type I [Plasmodium knowlesi strain H]OTN65302.1 SICAvar type I [Plasmodium knowlesi]CAA9989593.1 SICAvar, type I [Plasmodium knowlesi strain H]SBO22656.1 SICAvar, type I [Plasmodium knowlesi strain H]SBO23361.1 SICAvar, type I [Plasmodium knowlesi strain H]VVS79067.1 SICAvar, type I [Plasmodium knowlesi strain H]
MAEKFAGLLAKWMESKGQSVDAHAQLEKEMKGMFSALGGRLEEMKFPDEMNTACANVKERYGPTGRSHDKLICKTLIRIVYWMNGIDEKGKPEVEDSQGGEGLKELKQYLRCIVGYSAMIKLLSNKRDVENIIENVQKTTAKAIGIGGTGLLNEKCEDIKYGDISLGSQILGKPLAEWVQNLNREGGMLRAYMGWTLGMKKGDAIQEIDENNDRGTSVMELLREKKAPAIYKEVTPPAGAAPAEDKLKEVLQKAQSCQAGPGNKTMKDCIQKKMESTLAEVCMKNEEGKFCDRLKCAKDYWQLKEGQSNTGDFWGKHAKDKLENLFDTAISGSTTTAGAHCDTIAGLDTANKAACKLFTAKLEHMYKNGSGGPDQLSDQIIKCVLLNAYAKRLKEEAEKKGYCDIEKGLKKAFDQSSTVMSSSGKCKTGSNDNNCFECNWTNITNDGLDQCTIPNGTNQNDQVQDKVKELFLKNTQTQDDGIQKTLAKFNEGNSLCEYVNCAAKRAEENKGGSGTGQKDFWKVDDGAVKTLWTELSTAMEQSKGAGEEKCNKMGDNASARDATHSERKACNYLHAGLKKLYDGPTTTGDSDILKKNLSFRQAVGCFLLHSYAKHMKEKAACEIEAGIKRAFDTAGNGKSGNCQNGGKELCVLCQWKEDDYDKCKIKAGGTTTETNVENKLKDIVNKDNKDTSIQTMAKEVNNMEFCDRVQCVTAQWRKHRNTGNAFLRTWTPVWEEVKKEVTSFDNALPDSGGKDTQADSLCNDLTCPNGEQDCVSKETCKIIIKALKSIHEMQENGSGSEGVKLNDRIFRSSMRCIALNALMHKLKDQADKGGYGCAVQKGIEEAFKVGSEKRDTWCGKDNNGNGKNVGSCEECGKDNQCFSTKVGEKNLWTEVLGMLITPNIQQTLSKINKEATLCDRMNCIIKQWIDTNKPATGGGTSAGTDTFWDENGAVKKLWEELAEKMKKNGKTDQGKCNELPNPSDKTACNFLHAGLKQLYQPDPATATPGGGAAGILSEDNPSFRQTMGCFLLHAYAKHMKDKAVCDIEEGIKKAFDTVKNGLGTNTNCNDSANGKGPCVPCQWNDASIDKCDVKTGITGSAETAKEKVKKIIEEDKTNIPPMLKNINEMKTLCDGLKCIVSHLNSPNAQQQKVSTFWTEGGEVGELWKQLADAMTKTNNSNEGQCGKMDNGTNGQRDATNPEKKACNYLHTGFNKLKDITAFTPSQAQNGKILDKDPSLTQAMGCFLLHSYAKQMKDGAKCEIEAGIKKAFDLGKGLSIKGTCDGGAGSSGNEPCVPCQWDENILETCQITTNGTPEKVEKKLEHVESDINKTSTTNLTEINKTESLCDYIKCAGPKWFKKNQGKNGGAATNKTWCQFWDKGVKPTLEEMFKQIETNGKNPNPACTTFGDGNKHSVERKACNHITAGLQHIKTITSNTSPPNGKDNQLLDGAVGCIALNMYADQIIESTKESCPIGEDRITQIFKTWNDQNNNNSSSSPSCLTSGGKNNCFKCTRHKDFNGCKLSVDSSLVDKTTNGSCSFNEDKKDVQKQMGNLLNNEDQTKPNFIKSNITTTLSFITNMTSSFCTQVQCAAKKYHVTHNGAKSSDVTWNALRDEIGKELTDLLKDMNEATKQKDVEQYCKDDSKWNTKGHTERRTNRAACLHFAAGLQHIYGRPNGPKVGPVNGPSFGQTMGCLFLKEYAKQLEKMANEKKRGHSWVHPLCDIDKGIKHAFSKSEKIMKSVLDECSSGPNGISCFECKWANNDYDKCNIGNDSVKSKVEAVFKDEPNKDHMEKTLENTVCPILLTDLLTPFLPLAPVSIGLSAMAYYLWKYFGPLGKGGPRFRRSPAEIPGPSVQEHLLDHVEEAGPHEYRLVKERKPRSAPTRTKRSGGVNRRTIIEIHFEVLDECQKGDTQLNQKDFLELLVQEFMGSELMEEEQVPKEEVLMEAVPMEGVPMELVPIEEVPMERVPSLGSGLLV